MDTTTFDGLTRNLGSGLTRRSALRGLFAGAVAVVAGGVALEESSAKKRRKKHGIKHGSGAGGGTGGGNGNGAGGGNGTGGGQGQSLPAGAFCQSSAQCNAADGRICKVAVNAGNSDKTCCGATGAVCGGPTPDGDDTAPFCCVGFSCALTSQTNTNGTGRCQAIPDDGL